MPDSEIAAGLSALDKRLERIEDHLLAIQLLLAAQLKHAEGDERASVSLYSRASAKVRDLR